MSDVHLPAEEQFAVGEIVVVVRTEFVPENLGLEVLVVDGLALRRNKEWPDGEWSYIIRRSDGMRFCAKHYQLSRKKPPREDLSLVRWSECPWQPKQVRA